MIFAASPIRFSGDLSVWTVLALAVVAVLAVIWLYQRESQTLSSPYHILLPSLRATAVAMVIFILAGPVWHHRQVVGTLGRVIFAIDTSKSMSLVDSQGGREEDTRLRRASRLLFGESGSQGWIDEITKTHLVDVVGFDSTATQPVWSSAEDSDSGEAVDITDIDLTAEGPETDLSLPLAGVLSSLDLGWSGDSQGQGDSLRRAAVVLLSDGRETASANRLGRSAVVLAEQLAGAGTTVHTVGFGSTDEPNDIGIADVIHPETVAIDSRLAGEVIVGKYGDGREPITVRIESDGQTVWKDTFTFEQSGQRRVPFELDVRSLIETLRRRSPRGIERSNEVLRLTASVQTAGEDYTVKNNLARFRVAASTRNRRLLILDGSSRWETRYVKNLFQRDPAWRVDLLLCGPGTENEILPRGSQPGEFPETDEVMGQYDAVLLGEVHPELFSDDDFQRLTRFVASGGGLIVMDGRFGRLNRPTAGRLSELLPVRYRTRQVGQSPTYVAPTSIGLQQPSLALIDRSEQLESFWKQLPSPRWSADVELAEGAESWADAVWSDGRRSPWLATRMYGSGRVFYFAADQSWRWRYKVADRFHVLFWNQVVVAAIEPPYSASDQFVSIGTDQVEYQPGESIEVRARLQDTEGRPDSDATVDAVVMQYNTEVAVVPLSPRDPKRGTYSGLISALPDGEYSIRIRASGYDESALLATTPIWVGSEISREMLRLSLDVSALEQIANAGAGRYAHESDADEILSLLRPLSSGTVIESDTVLWQSYFWFVPIIFLLATEWYLRKRAGLV
ncbi:MAG: hypothetical protein AAGJ83_01560 [Planctomycetota bacterium]